MSVLALMLGLIAFIAVLRILNAAQVAGEVFQTTQDALGVMANTDVSDAEKEAQVRRASLTLLGKFFWIAFIGVAAFAASTLLVWGGAALGFYTLEHAIAVALGWPFIISSTGVAVLLWLALDKMKPKPATAQTAEPTDVPYNQLDIALHDFAFASPRRQRSLGDFETTLLKRRINQDHARRPVFVTSLPRAGTTIMLEVLASLPDFASATYRHMPFTLSPLLWGGLSGAFRKPTEKAERAHGDGIEVGFDSPEAFEEMVWMAFWADHYGDKHVTTWDAQDKRAEFETFFRTHMAKIVATKTGAGRYISKNNANIARLGLIEQMFPDASIIIPIRNPCAQVQSLLRQHKRFGDLHDRAPFARRYMEGVGHLEFGRALRPIAFEGGTFHPSMAHQPEFWLRYWIAAYTHVLATAGPAAIFVDHDATCTDPMSVLPQLAEALDLEMPGNLIALAPSFRAPGPIPDVVGVSNDLLHQADELHRQLCARAIGTFPASTQRFAT
ncbi:sulfotransferase [Tateyamaria sp. SN3-11]|uniref:sulfotransferase n=1 Tax=Tateyamaria sp. SN3-11 TaxID=3092147 RepID=UPI0039ED7D86